MVFLSAQSDFNYYIWQLQIQIYNFLRIGILPSSIHIIVGIKPNEQLNNKFSEFIELNKEKARFFIYTDDRVSNRYPSSIRPNLIKKHFKNFPNLTDQVIFYHDCDIIFKRKPDIRVLSSTDKWYVSDTRSYIAPAYILKFGEDVFTKMCSIVNVSPIDILNIEEHSGGAQYILKNIHPDFWEKVERDSESLFEFLEEKNKILREQNKTTIQSWCADMWAVLWNAIYFNQTVNIHKELEFCWPSSNIKEWSKVNIFHNSGILNHQANDKFCKALYTNFPPYYENFSYIDRNVCSKIYAKEIISYRDSISKIDLTDVTVVIVIKFSSTDDIMAIDASMRFINKFFKTVIRIVEIGDIQRINAEKLEGDFKYSFYKDHQPVVHSSKYNNKIIRNIDTKFVMLYDYSTIISPENIVDCINHLRNAETIAALPHNSIKIEVSKKFLEEFAEHLDYNLIDMKNSKLVHKRIETNFYGGCVLINKEQYAKIGLDNELIFHYHKNDFERIKRIEILGGMIYYSSTYVYRFQLFHGAVNSHYTRKILEKDGIMCMKTYGVEFYANKG